MEWTRKGWRPIVLVILLLLCRNSWLLLPMRPQINGCLVNFDYRLQAENTFFIKAVFSSVSDNRLHSFIQSLAFLYSMLLILTISSCKLFFSTSLGDNVSATIIIWSNYLTKYFILIIRVTCSIDHSISVFFCLLSGKLERMFCILNYTTLMWLIGKL